MPRRVEVQVEGPESSLGLRERPAAGVAELEHGGELEVTLGADLPNPPRGARYH